MLEGLKRHWREFKQGPPGKRFQQRYERNRKTRHERSPWIRFLKPIAAILLLALGLFFCAIPGPGVPILILGAGLLADVSRPVAVALDWLDLRIRAVWKRLRLWWRQASLPMKLVAVFAVLLLLGGAGYGACRLFQ